MDQKKIIIIITFILLVVLIAINNNKIEDKNQEKDLNTESVNTQAKDENKDNVNTNAPSETKLIKITKNNLEGIDIVFDLNQSIDLGLNSNDDIYIKALNKSNGEKIIEKSKVWNEYLLDTNNNKVENDIIQPGTYKIVFTKEELKNIDINNIHINILIRKNGNDIYSTTTSVITFGESGHIEVSSVSPEPNEYGVRYKWQLSNPTNDKTNVLFTNAQGNEQLLSTDINPGEVVSVYTNCDKGSTLKVHTRQLDNSYLIKDVIVDNNVIKVEPVTAESVQGDINSNGTTIKWKLKNPNSNIKTNVIIKDGVGGVIMQLDLDGNNEKVVDIDINRGRSIIVETRMGNGTYSGKQYSVKSIEEPTHIVVNSVEVSDNNGVKNWKIEFENTMNGRTNIIVKTGDDINQLAEFQLGPNEKRIMDINITYINSINIQTRQFDGNYAIKSITAPSGV